MIRPFVYPPYHCNPSPQGLVEWSISLRYDWFLTCQLFMIMKSCWAWMDWLSRRNILYHKLKLTIPLIFLTQGLRYAKQTWWMHLGKFPSNTLCGLSMVPNGQKNIISIKVDIRFSVKSRDIRLALLSTNSIWLVYFIYTLNPWSNALLHQPISVVPYQQDWIDSAGLAQSADLAY